MERPVLLFPMLERRQLKSDVRVHPSRPRVWAARDTVTALSREPEGNVAPNGVPPAARLLRD